MGLGEKCKQKRYSRKLTLSMKADNLLYGTYDGYVVWGEGGESSDGLKHVYRTTVSKHVFRKD